MKKIAVILTFTLALCFALFLLRIQDATAQPCDCDLTPATTTIIRGQTLEIDVTVTNNTSFAGNVSFAANITKPDSTTTDWVNGPLEFFIAGYGSPSGHVSYDIPTSWPLGTYTYHGYVGNPGNIYCESQFDFVVAMALPKTGQTTCYDELGAVIDCGGTGQDGEYQKGTPWPNPRFTDNGDGTVTDNMTGLVWLKNANCFGFTTWADALSDCNGLASGSCGLDDGSSAGDWRLPNRFELDSLLDLSYFEPALPDWGYPFTGVQLFNYWSATTFESYYADWAWGVDMTQGGALVERKSDPLGYVWPVRGPN